MPGKLNLREAAEFLGCAERTLYKWLYGKDSRRPAPRHFKYMGKLYFDKKDLEAYKRHLIEERG